MGHLDQFEEFVRMVFDHDDPEWMWAEDDEAWKLEHDPANVVDCLTRVFEVPALVYPRYTSEQVAVGVNYLISPSLGNVVFCLLDAGVPLDDRLRALRSIRSLYEGFFARALPSEESNGSSKSRASFVCYMFWDVFPFFGRTTNPFTRDEPDVRARWEEHLAIERTCIGVLEQTLAIDHLACQEGALHGLGHWHSADEVRVENIIDDWLARVEKRNPLRDYAKQARKGTVL